MSDYRRMDKERTRLKAQGQGQGQIFGLGDKVFHQKWGEGVVVGTKGQGSEIELTIAFPNQGLKTVLAKYAPLKKLR